VLESFRYFRHGSDIVLRANQPKSKRPPPARKLPGSRWFYVQALESSRKFIPQVFGATISFGGFKRLHGFGVVAPNSFISSVGAAGKFIHLPKKRHIIIWYAGVRKPLNHVGLVVMPREGAIIFRDLVGKLDVLNVECGKCGPRGRCHLHRLIVRYGIDAKLCD
jgi:hypothetical protein